MKANNSDTKAVLLSTKEGYHVLPYDDIIRLEASKNYTTFHCIGRPPVRIAKTLKEYEKILPYPLFFRIHKSHIVNIHQIVQWIKDKGGQLEMKDKYLVPISRYKRKAFKSVQKGRSVYFLK